jgi:two-component system OmpR family sensor kinase
VVRIEGSHEVIELEPGGRRGDPGRAPEPDVAPSQLAEWWQSVLARARDRLLQSPAGRAVERIPRRAKVVISLIAIAAAGFVALGIGAGIVLRDYVVGRAESQLKATTEQLQPSLGARGFYAFLRPLPEGVEAQRRDPDGDIRDYGGFDDISTSSGPDLPARLPPPSDRPFSVADRSGGGRWLVLVSQSPDSEYSLVVAADVGPGYQAVGRLTEISIVIGGLAVAAMVFVGFRAARSSASSLSKIEETVEAAVAGDLTRRVPEPAADGEPGQVARAVNALIEQIDDARQAEERTRRTVGEAGRAMRQPLNVIQGFTEFYRERAAQDPERMARLIDRVGDEAARIEIVIDDLVSDMRRAGNGSAPTQRGQISG